MAFPQLGSVGATASMFDLHCHILPGIDDGAVDLEDALAMAACAHADGIETVCATPHVRADHDVRLTELPERVTALQTELRRQGIPVRVLAGAEVGQEKVPELAAHELCAATLGGGGRWILLEPAPGPLDQRLSATVDALGRRGFSCVIAHPERHPSPDLPRCLAALARRGALIQVTAALLAEGEASAVIMDLARCGLVHVLGSDAHSSRIGRPLALRAGLARLTEIAWLHPHLDWIARGAPAAILRGDPVRSPFAPRAEAG